MTDVMTMAQRLAAVPAQRRHDAALLMIDATPPHQLKILAHMMLSQLAQLRVAVETGGDDAAEMVALLPLESWGAAARDYADTLADEQMVNAVVRLVVLEQALRIRAHSRSTDRDV